MKNKGIAVGLMVGTLIALGWWLNQNVINQTSVSDLPSNKLQVAASFYPLSYFASEVGKDQVEVKNLTPAGAEPHDYEPNAQDITQLEKTDLLLVNGLGFEPWLDKVQSDLEAKGIQVVAVAEGLASLESEDGTVPDPHIWLDPVLAQQEVLKIAQAMSQVDPTNQTVYEANSQQLVAKLKALDQDFRQGLAQCQQKNILTSHQAFGYLASRYGLTQVSLTGLSPDQEPTPAELGQVAQFAKANQVKYIFFETLVSPRLAETLAREVGAQTIVFNPLEGLTSEDQAAGLDYFSVQRDNLSHLRTALECQ
jgi:zinc transport system substrate-binding protein